MGFSLSRALAGAVVGGAHAAGDVFSDQLAEAAKDRARVADEERAFRVAEHADSLLAAREARKQEMLDIKEKEKRKLYSELVAEQVAGLKEKGVSVGGAEGQRAIGQAFVEKGYPEFANTFFDNAQRAQQADDNKELKKIQLANAAATHALARETKAAAREGKIGEAAKAEQKRYDDYVNDFDIKWKKDDGTSGNDPTLKHWMLNLTGGLVTKDPYAANELVRKMGMVINDVRGENPDASPARIRALAEERLRPKSAPAQAAAAPSSTPPKQIIPGIMDTRSTVRKAQEASAEQGLAAWQSGVAFP